MENKQTPSKKWLQFDIDDSENEDDSKSEKEHQREQKIYDCAIEQKDLRQKQNTRSIDKFGANKVSKGFFAQQTEDFQFNEPQETLRIKPPTKQTKEENGEVQSKDYQPKSLPLLQHHESQQQDQQAQKDQGSYQNPCYIGFRSQAILSLQSKPAIKSKLFNLNLSDSEDSSSGKSGSSKEHQKQEEEQPDTQRKSQLDQQLKEQQEPEDQPKSEAKEEHVLQDFVFDKDPQFQVLDEIRPHERLRAMISRSRTGLNMIWPEYQVKLEDGTLILTAKKQSFSLKSTYKIYTKSKDGKERYFGKVQSNLTGNAYTIYVSEDGINEIMKAEVFFPNENRSNQPRHFTTFSLLNGFSLQYLAQEDIKQKEGPFPLQNLYRIPLNRDKVVSMQTRKPVYHQKLRGYVLNFNGRVNVPSIKNIILQKTLTHEEVLMFGRVDKNCFRLQVSHPLNCVIGTAIGLIQFQAKFMD